MGGAQSHVKAMNMIESVVELFKNKRKCFIICNFTYNFLIFLSSNNTDLFYFQSFLNLSINLCLITANADWDEVADMLGDMMDDEFNTICEDDSTDEVGTLLWEFYKICISGDNDLVEAEIAKLPSGNHWLSKCLEQTSNRNNSNAQVCHFFL